MAEERPEWQQLELLIANIQKDLAPGTTVTHNATLHGYDSETDRQIDVLVEQQIGQFPMRIIFDCKDYARPVNVKGVESFAGMVRDVRAHQGCLVSAKGFTVSAKKLAKKLGMAIYSPIDTAPHKWQVKGLALPVLCEFRGTKMGFGIQVTGPMPFRMENGFFYDGVVHDVEGNPLGTCVDVAVSRWNNGEYPIEVGEHENVPIFPVSPYVDNGYGTQVQVTLTVSLLVEGRRYFGMMPITEIRGLRDEHTGAVVMNAFKTHLVSPEQIESGWLRLKDGAEPPKPVAVVITGLDCWEIEGRKLR
ncbi:MAG: restriction endonuclease [Betaproteobacteria bacterium]|nr:restriction endonuclease [Betaproteobacteria bacterium]